MPRFFHVDRSGALTAGQVIDRAGHNVGLPEFQTVFDRLFPDGVSRWGAAFVAQAGRKLDLAPGMGADALSETHTTYAEFILELVRRSAWLDKPSRFSSVFAVKTLAEAKQLRAERGWGNTPIVRVDGTPGHRGDMRLVGTASTILVAWYYADRYWSSQPHPMPGAPAPLWEELLLPTITVVERVR